MRHTDIAIVGGGLAGAMAAAMLGRSGYKALVIDPHAVYPKDFRCEKLDRSQVGLLQKTGLAEAVLKAATPDNEVWIARLGRLVDKRPNRQSDILYDTLVNTVRSLIPSGTAFVHAKVSALALSPQRQTVTLSNGEEISARLVLLANGLNTALRATLGIERKVLSPGHSISVGFDIAPAGRPAFDFRALTYYPEHTSDRFAYLTIFPLSSTLRANFFVYRDLRDPWFKSLREAPEATLNALMPGLAALTGRFEITSEIDMRPVDLYATGNYRQAGLALVGDAFSTSCPAAGTGVNKVITDVERLCNVYIPRWLATDGMGAEKIAQFYDDPIKQACDRHSADKAFFLRSLSTDDGAIWRARRLYRFLGNIFRAWLRFSRGSRPRRQSPLVSSKQNIVAMPTRFPEGV